MTVIQLDITAADDPLGTILTTLTDEDVASFEMRKAENSLGAGSFTIRRDHPSATAANLAEDNYVRVTIPIISPDPCFGFFLEHHDDSVLAQGEEGAETLTRQGPGSLAIIGRAAFLDEHYATVPPASDDRGSPNEIAGYWRWQHKQYGQIFVRLIEEGQTEPGTPLADVTLDFDRDVDSDGVDWPAIDRDVRFEIGTDGLTFMERFAETGEVFITMDPDLEAHARQARGTDRTSGSFASGKVRLVKGVNIQTELVRSADTTMAATHAIVIGMENNTVQVVSPSYVSGPGKWVTIHYDNSNDTGVLEKVGAEALRRGVADLQEITMEIRAGDEPLTGRYLPFVHFDTGDVITVHTGTDPNDYNEASERVRAFTIALRDTSDDTARGLITGDEMAARSLIVGVECGGAAGTFGVDLNVTVEEKGCGGCPPPPPIHIIPGDVSGFSCTMSDATSHSYTAGGARSGLGLAYDGVHDDWRSVSSDFIQYGSIPLNSLDPAVPTPGLTGIWAGGGGGGSSDDDAGTYGDTDYTTGGANHYVKITGVGPGTLTLYVVAGSPGPGAGAVATTIDGYLYDNNGGAGSIAGTGNMVGGSGSVVVPDGTCDWRVEIFGDHNWGFTSALWEPTDPGVPDLPVGGQRVDVSFTGDGTTTSFTNPLDTNGDPLEYRADSLRVEVVGLDWTTFITETGPGTYDSAYPFPLGATVNVSWDAP